MFTRIVDWIAVRDVVTGANAEGVSHVELIAEVVKGPAKSGCAFLCDMCDRDAATYLNV